ncbi:TIGR03086 family metal-binding protein [Saccharopolyspora shandongensis]|uniref:TIGR03086 family protein n=1 Tax=Saccharopolyspora shandongensis TaxID=418495 RepID=A0A1H3LR60_9PSEU|nr:TIGR03086 family metal-binding protein [Saccharopolyspora shandongensis]SDY66922.1 TIGR03086 family protein [Saccharopolyspora shandongensis]
MTDLPDLGPAAEHLATLLGNVADEQLGAPTPCTEYTLGDLIDHVSGLSLAFAAAAAKDSSLTGGGPSGDATRLPADWRARIPTQLTAVAEAWREPAAWDGMTQAGGIQLPGQVAGVVALNELVVHGWDIAKATGQQFRCDAASLATALEFVSMAATEEPSPDSPFGPTVAVPADATPLDKLIGLTGRNPAWQP